MFWGTEVCRIIGWLDKWSVAAYHSVFSGSILSQHQHTWHVSPGSGKEHSGSTLEPTQQLQQIQLSSCSWALVNPLHITPHLLVWNSKDMPQSQDWQPKTKKSWMLTQPCSQGESHAGTPLIARGWAEPVRSYFSDTMTLRGVALACHK